MAKEHHLFPRSSGILLHPTSLPGKYGIGDLGTYAYQFVDWLEAAGQSVWQVLPLGPTSYGDSPYQALSAFAGNPLLISFDDLVEQGWLTAADLRDVPAFPAQEVDYGWVIDYHNRILSLAYEGFEAKATPQQRTSFHDWCARNADWLDDFVLFVALKNKHGGNPWVEWPEGEALRQEAALENVRRTHARALNEQRFRQWVFFQQWQALKDYAADRGIRLIGDIPIFVAHDSADVWANRDLFYLDAMGRPTVVAGVPPDYFSPTGQYWGNPLYRWDKIAEDGYDWWIRRFRMTLATVDIVRVDHFRGFSAYWEVPVNEERSAVKGRWIPGPDTDFFDAVQAQFGELPIIAEDLGVITEDVEKLRDDFNLPGMKVLQFAWSDPKNPFLPHNHVPNAVVYTGTHDNNTTLGWWLNPKEATPETKAFMQTYIGHEVEEPTWEMIRLSMMSVAHTCIIPLQDIWGLGEDTRMNKPSTDSGNWQWRFTPEWLEHEAKERLAVMTQLYQRRPDQQEKEYGDAAVKSG